MTTNRHGRRWSPRSALLQRARADTDTRTVPLEDNRVRARVAMSDADLAAVTQTISQAFHEDPTWSWAFPDPIRRPRAIRHFLVSWSRARCGTHGCS